MPEYHVELYELWSQTYAVEAESEAEAVKKVFDGQGAAVDDGLGYVEMASDYGLPTDHYRELAAELRKIGVSVDDCIPGVRAVAPA